MAIGETIGLIEALGNGGGGSSLPPVTPSDNGKVLGVVDGAWAAQANDIVLNATYAYDDGGVNYDVTITSALPSAADLEAYFSNGKSIVLHFTDAPWDARLYPELKEVDSSTGTYYSFIGEGIGFDFDKYKYVLRFTARNGTVTCFGKVYIGDKFIVTLTPTSLDYSGTMDKTVAEIQAAYEAGMEIWFYVAGQSVKMTQVYESSGYLYPSFGGVLYDENNHLIIIAATGVTDDGTHNGYATDLFTLTPAS